MAQPIQITYEGTVLASGARSVSTVGPDMVNAAARGVIIFLNVTVAPGTDTIKIRLRAKDPISGTYVTLQDGSTTAVTGMQTLIVAPGLTAATGTIDVAPISIPKVWNVQIVASALTSFTYSVGYTYLP